MMETITVIVRRNLFGAGAERVVLDTARGLQTEHRSVIILTLDSQNDFNENDVNIHQLKIPRWIKFIEEKLRKRIPLISDHIFSPIFSRYLMSEIKLITEKFHISDIQIHGMSTFGVFKNFKHPQKRIFCHAVKSLHLNNSRSKINNIINKWLFKKIIKQEKFIVGVSAGVLTDLQESFNIPPQNLHLQYNPIDVDSIIAKSKLTLFQWPRRYITFVGRLTTQKNIKLLINAYSQSKLRFDCDLLVVGEGGEKDDLVKLAKDLGLANKVHFLGFLTNPYPIIAGAETLCLSSNYEGFGLVIAESIALGTPVISTDCQSGPLEIIQDPYFLCAVGDVSAYSALLDKILTQEFRVRASRLSVDRFRPENTLYVAQS